jgi:hypothetical protein
MMKDKTEKKNQLKICKINSSQTRFTRQTYNMRNEIEITPRKEKQKNNHEENDVTLPTTS